MPLVEVSCPRCHAPVDVPGGATTVKCRFCGTTLRDLDSTKPVVRTRTVHVLVLDRVGPSNRARAWDLLTKIVGLAPAAAEEAIRNSPGDAGTIAHEHADAILAELREHGVSARLDTREVEIPPSEIVPDHSVHLDAVGPDKVAVMKIIREHLDCGVYDAKAFVERAPCLLVGTLGGKRAGAFVESLVAAGAKARLEDPS
jgi:LSD1 subclass zinc finger protein